MTASSVLGIERELAGLRRGDDGEPYQRTSVMTHIAWVPAAWVDAAADVLAHLAERHPSRTIVLTPEPGVEGPLEADVSVDCFPVGAGRSVCTETIKIRLPGRRADVPGSVVEPLLITDLPVFLRWRGTPDWNSEAFVQLTGIADRLIVDSTEWPDLAAAYPALAQVFDRVVVSDIAWARTSRWRSQLAGLWPEIANVQKIRVEGTAAQAQLLAGWLRSRLDRPVEVENVPSDRLVGVEVDGKPAPFPPGDPPDPADLLSDELETFTRDLVYEAAVRAAT